VTKTGIFYRTKWN